MPRATSIFKYRSFCKTSLELFINKELWFAKPDSLNDPFECQMLFSEVLKSIWRNHEISKKQQQEIKCLLSKQIEEIGLCSFSKTRKNQLMWAHYADEHKGFCIGFNESKLKRNSNITNSQIVEYQSDLPYKQVIKEINPSKNSSTAITENILKLITKIKYTNWKYEREVRLINYNYGAIKFCPSSVVSIAFGLRMPEREKETLKELLSTNEWKHLKWYQAEKQPDKFALLFKEIKPAHSTTTISTPMQKLTREKHIGSQPF